MSLAHVILGLLQEQAMTGYDLKTSCFDQCIGHLWPADQAQIYRTLEKLVEQGYITCTIEIQHDRPNRKVYTITESGKAELVLWLGTHQPLPILREPMLIQLHFGDQLPNEIIIHLLEQQLAARNEKLAKCENIDLPLLGDESASREEVMQRLVLELVIRREQTYIDWLKTAINVISQENPHSSQYQIL
ncbi:MAG: PadR family transcriptional regulator [Desmonostoc geniculatum HA4340-LM1]|jgi:DNA-binding PadR family transcriptional regulator|nr:PadR family transcriptional regulator [Desmonostoc geniculatum HA4340-LM1]